MKKIKLKAEINSVPLSQKELRKIVGGAESHSCKCKIYDSNNNQISYVDMGGTTSAALSPDDCDSACNDLCDFYSGVDYIVEFRYTKDGN